MSPSPRRPLPWQRQPHPPPPLPPTLPDGSPWPRISIVTPSFNQGDFLEETLLSVAQQDYPNSEHLVIDGGSTDGSARILERWRGRLTDVVSEPDRGQAHAINKGFERATGEILTWLNSDDLLAPGALAAVAMAFHTSPADLVAGVACLFTEDGTVDRHLTACPDGPLPLDELLDLEGRWHAGQFFYQPEVMFRREIFERVGGALREDLLYSLDYDLWVRFAEAGARLHVIGRPVAWFRVHAAQKTHVAERFRAELEAYRAEYLAARGLPEPARTAAEGRRRLRVVLLNDHGFHYGAGLAHQRLGQSLAAAGHDVHALAIAEAERDASLPTPSSETVARAVAALAPDVVLAGNLHAAGASPELLARVAAIAPTMAVLHDFWWLTGRCGYPGSCDKYLTGCDTSCPTADEAPVLAPKKIGPAWRAKGEALRSSPQLTLLANSDWSASFARSTLAARGLDEVAGRLARIQLGFPLALFVPRDRAAARRALGLPLDRFIVLLSGNRSDRRKRLDSALAALARLALPDLTVVVLGSATPGETFPLPDVRMAGYVRDLERSALYYAAADLFVSAAREETLGQVYLEAAACGTPAVGFCTAGVAEALADGITGRFASAPTEEALAEAVLALYRDPQRRRDLGGWGRVYVENEWSLFAAYRRLFLAWRELGLADRLGLAPKIAFPPEGLPVTAANIVSAGVSTGHSWLRRPTPRAGLLGWYDRWWQSRPLREVELDLRGERFHREVARWRGLSYAEPWGRWSDGARVELLFHRPLPQRLRLELLAAALGDNARLPIGVQVGEAATDLRVAAEIVLEIPGANGGSVTSEGAASADGDGGGVGAIRRGQTAGGGQSAAGAESPLRHYVVELETSGRDRVLTLHVPRPMAPAQIAAGASSDWRRLGVALARIAIRDAGPQGRA
jgi:glycosyltransferase involved in cell wall biosynthesis